MWRKNTFSNCLHFRFIWTTWNFCSAKCECYSSWKIACQCQTALWNSGIRRSFFFQFWFEFFFFCLHVAVISWSQMVCPAGSVPRLVCRMDSEWGKGLQEGENGFFHGCKALKWDPGRPVLGSNTDFPHDLGQGSHNACVQEISVKTLWGTLILALPDFWVLKKMLKLQVKHRFCI